MKTNMVAASYHPLVVCGKMTKAYDLNVSTISRLTATEIYWKIMCENQISMCNQMVTSEIRK